MIVEVGIALDQFLTLLNFIAQLQENTGSLEKDIFTVRWRWPKLDVCNAAAKAMTLSIQYMSASGTQNSYSVRRYSDGS